MAQGGCITSIDVGWNGDDRRTSCEVVWRDGSRVAFG